MTAENAFQILSNFASQAAMDQAEAPATSFVAWQGFGVVKHEEEQDGEMRIGLKPGMPLSPEEARQHRLLKELESKHQQALADVQARAAENQAKGEELTAREQAMAAKESELLAREGDLASQSAALNALMKDFEEMKKGYWRENASEIVDFALALAERVVLQRIVEDPSLIVKHVQAVLEEMKIDETMTIRLAADDLESLRRSDKEEIRAFLANPQVKWLGDTRLSTGDVHIDASRYRLDASILTAMRNVSEDIKSGDQNAVEKGE